MKNFVPIDPGWGVAGNTTATPQCGYKVNTSPYRVTLDFWPAVRRTHFYDLRTVWWRKFLTY
jgi:hypothetical protein